MDDRIWNTEPEYERVNDEDARALLREQLRRQIDEITQLQRRERDKDEEEREKFIYSFFIDDLNVKKKEKILKPLPDELFEI
jgi:hypothetical protein